MKHINENNAVSFFQHRDFMRGVPFYGEKGDFNFVLGRSQFTPGISIKLVPLSDMSVKGDPGISPFASNVNLIKNNYKKGDRVRGVIVNSQLETEDGRIAVGKLDDIKVDWKNHTIRIFIKDPETLEKKEIYVDTMERIFESFNGALTFSEFINS